MNNNELNQYIKHYLEEDKTHSAIMLTGDWGTGKSYYVQNCLIPFLENENNGKHKCVVVSLYGLSSLYDLSKALYFGVRLKPIAANMSEAGSTGMFAAKTILKGVTSFFGVDLSKSEAEMQQLYESIDLTGRLIILEDLERSNIDIIELLGYWLELLFETGYVDEQTYKPLQNSCGAIRRMLISSIKTIKEKNR